MLAAAFLVAAIVFSYSSKNEIAVVKYSFSGCFGHEESNLRVYKKNDKLIAHLKTDGKPNRENVIDSSQLISLKVFVQEIKGINDNLMGTSVITYCVEYNNDLLRITDNSGSTSAFENLKKSLLDK